MSALSSQIIVACWFIFIAYWLLSALRTKPIAQRQSLLSSLAHRIPLGFGYWLLAYPNFPPALRHQILPQTLISQAAGALMCVCGLLFTLWARYTLGGNWSSNVTFKRGHELVRAGPYRMVRHPIYTGLLAMFLGTALRIGEVRGALSLISVCIAFWIKIGQEERLLMGQFPETYRIYQKEVKAIVPFVV